MHGPWADYLIAFSLFWLSFSFAYLTWKRESSFPWTARLFVLALFLCAATHLVSGGALKVAAAIVSLAAAIALARRFSLIAAMPSARQTAALARSNVELEQFARVVSHDLQEPLRKIISFGDLLQASAGPALDEKSRDYLARMRRAAVRMQQLIRGLLEYSKIAAGTRAFQKVDLKEIAAEVLSDLEAAVQGARAEVSLGELPSVEADALQMRQLIQNLVGNALKFRKKDTPARVTISGRIREDGWAEISVADEGIGFDEKYLARIFQPFQRLNTLEEFEGTGMGLAICQKIVQGHGGSITAASSPGKGSTFTVRLPLTQNFSY